MNYIIQQPDSSVSILKIQRCLNLLHPDELQIKEDGIYGPETEKAVKAFQRKTGLVDDGILESMTWDKIIMKVKTLKNPEEVMIHVQRPLQYGDKGLDVVKAQEYLNMIQPEYPVEVNGIFDAKTQVKVIRFQNMTGLNPDGRIGILTWDKIIEYV